MSKEAEIAKDFAMAQERKLGATMMRWSAGIAAVPDPIPLVDEILLGVVFGVGAGLYIHGSGLMPGPPKFKKFGRHKRRTQSHPVTSISGHSERRVKKQISSTSRPYYSRRNNYYKRKQYYYGN